MNKVEAKIVYSEIASLNLPSVGLEDMKPHLFHSSDYKKNFFNVTHVPH